MDMELMNAFQAELTRIKAHADLVSQSSENHTRDRMVGDSLGILASAAESLLEGQAAILERLTGIERKQAQDFSLTSDLLSSLEHRTEERIEGIEERLDSHNERMEGIVAWQDRHAKQSTSRIESEDLKASAMSRRLTELEREGGNLYDRLEAMSAEEEPSQRGKAFLRLSAIESRMDSLEATVDTNSELAAEVPSNSAKIDSLQSEVRGINVIRREHTVDVEHKLSQLREATHKRLASHGERLVSVEAKAGKLENSLKATGWDLRTLHLAPTAPEDHEPLKMQPCVTVDIPAVKDESELTEEILKMAQTATIGGILPSDDDSELQPSEIPTSTPKFKPIVGQRMSTIDFTGPDGGTVNMTMTFKEAQVIAELLQAFGAAINPKEK